MTAAAGTLPRGARADAVDVAAEVARRFGRHGMTTYAAALACRGALALFPFLLLVVAVAHTVGLGAVTDWLTAHAAVGQPSEEAAAFVAWLRARLQEPVRGGLLSAATATALWSVAAGIRELRRALAAAAGATDEPAPLWRQLLISVGLAPVLAVVVIAAAASLLVTTRAIGAVVGWAGGDPARAEAWAWLRVPVVLVVVALLAAAVYRYGSNTRVPFRRVLPGALLAAVGWTFMSLAFSAALATVLDYGATYGSFGAAIALLVYLLLSAVVVLLGAEVNVVLADAGENARGASRAR